MSTQLPTNIAKMHLGFLRAQGAPFIGPLIVSPAAALVSTAELIAGFTAALFMLPFGILCSNKPCLIHGIKAHALAIIGLTALVYSLANILTLGILGFHVEKNLVRPLYQEKITQNLLSFGNKLFNPEES
jgi:hypothetical protein